MCRSSMGTVRTPTRSSRQVAPRPICLLPRPSVMRSIFWPRRSRQVWGSAERSQGFSTARILRIKGSITAHTWALIILSVPDFTTAEAIAQTLRNPGALAVERFARGRIEMQQLPVSDSAAVIGKRLVEAKFPVQRGWCLLNVTERHSFLIRIRWSSLAMW